MAAEETVAIPSTSGEVVYATRKQRPTFEIGDDDDEDDDDDDDDDEFIEEEAQTFGMECVGPIASPYLLPYF